MKKSILFILVLFFAGLQQASAKITLGKSERIKVVHDFPDTEEYMDEDGNYMDLGILYETFDIARMPYWVTKKPVIVGLLNKNTDYYLEIEPEVADEVIAAHNLDKEKLLALSFWDKHLGLVVLIVGLALSLIYAIYFHKDNDEEKTDDVIEIIEDEKVK